MKELNCTVLLDRRDCFTVKTITNDIRHNSNISSNPRWKTHKLIIHIRWVLTLYRTAVVIIISRHAEKTYPIRKLDVPHRCALSWFVCICIWWPSDNRHSIILHRLFKYVFKLYAAILYYTSLRSGTCICTYKHILQHSTCPRCITTTWTHTHTHQSTGM